MLQSMVLQRVRNNWVTEQQQQQLVSLKYLGPCRPHFLLTVPSGLASKLKAMDLFPSWFLPHVGTLNGKSLLWPGWHFLRADMKCVFPPTYLPLWPCSSLRCHLNKCLKTFPSYPSSFCLSFIDISLNKFFSSNSLLESAYQRTWVETPLIWGFTLIPIKECTLP